MPNRSFLVRLAAATLIPLSAAAMLAATAAPAAHGPSALTARRACPASQLRAAVVSDQGGMMHRELSITLTNSGASACVIDGFPAIRLLDAQRRAAINAESFSGTPQAFTLAPGKRAAFGIRVATSDGVTVYPTMRTLAIIPPGDVVALMLPHALPAGPTIDVKALVPG
jgi:hypothetical protein